MIKRPNDELRLVVDFRALNAITEPLAYPFPSVNDQVLDLHGSKIYSQLDLKSGFYHVRMQESDKAKTSFVIFNEHYEFNRMAMGLMNSPRFFQRIIARIFSKLKFVKVFVDDILIFSRDETEHIVHLKTVLNLLEENNLTIRFDKSSFFKTEIKFLGHVLNENGIKPARQQFNKLSNCMNPKINVTL